MTDATHNSQVVESYWELLKNLDAGIRLALITRLAQSLEHELSGTTGSTSAAFRAGGIAGNAAGRPTDDASEAFWWDTLEG